MQNGSSKIQKIIKEMDEYITVECKPYPLSKTKIIVDRVRMENFLTELDMKTPVEIKRFQKFLENRDAILEDAQNKADMMLSDANANVERLVNEHEIVQMAQEQADEILAEAQRRAQRIVSAAQKEAEEMKAGALAYAGESLDNLQILIANTINTVDSKMTGLMNSMQNYYSIIEENRKEIEAISQPEVQETVEEAVEPVMEPVMEEDLPYADLSYE